MQKQIESLRNHYIVCGIGRVGSNVANELLATGRTFAVVESDREALDRWLEHDPDALYLHEDAASDDALVRAGVLRSAGVFAVTSDDSHNLMVALSVKLLNPKCRVVVRLHDIRNSNKARKAGADEIVSPDFTGGMRIASAMVRPHVVNFMDQMLRSEDALRVEEVRLPEQFSSRALSTLAPRSPDYLLMAIHEGGNWTFNPEESFVLIAGMTLVLMTTPGGRQHIEQRVQG
jgi:voltage-gated potassium channel